MLVRCFERLTGMFEFPFKVWLTHLSSSRRSFDMHLRQSGCWDIASSRMIGYRPAGTLNGVFALSTI
jgi:hypothetical protein